MTKINYYLNHSFKTDSSIKGIFHISTDLFDLDSTDSKIEFVWYFNEATTMNNAHPDQEQ